MSNCLDCDARDEEIATLRAQVVADAEKLGQAAGLLNEAEKRRDEYRASLAEARERVERLLQGIKECEGDGGCRAWKFAYPSPSPQATPKCTECDGSCQEHRDDVANGMYGEPQATPKPPPPPTRAIPQGGKEPQATAGEECEGIKRGLRCSACVAADRPCEKPPAREGDDG